MEQGLKGAFFCISNRWLETKNLNFKNFGAAKLAKNDLLLIKNISTAFIDRLSTHTGKLNYFEELEIYKILSNVLFKCCM